MLAVWKFRLTALLIAILVGAVSGANLAAEYLRAAPMPFPSAAATAPTEEQIAATTRAAAIAPFRADLIAERALALANPALKSTARGDSDQGKVALGAIQSALRVGPHDSRMWLVLALVQARNNSASPLVTESLKMSYLTGPNLPDLIPVRLDAVTANNALADADLGDLARSDVRALLTQLPGQRQTLVTNYARASEIGKKFLEQGVTTIDPGFVDKLKKK